MWRAPQKKLEESVKLAARTPSSGCGRCAPASICSAARPTCRDIRGPLPAARRALKPFPQLGETGAHRMLLFAADHPILPVDARINRVGRRLGYGEPGGDFKKQSRSVQAALAAELPESLDAYRRAFLYLSHHGGATCTEADPHCVGVSAVEGLSAREAAEGQAIELPKWDLNLNSLSRVSSSARQLACGAS